ncbi:LAETG motif-containing sortase-dependent surface protein [Streptomyces sp. 891-h]|uniref:LAETG motif-containing sortase-dependent surface protein n=1 Tax=unclassified Streptomyces TaxID=2593676 RepID=UPI001FAAC29C|nr:LAETG motif-containing sortase-dependent surface protein [Streptomyces sp. 891-h]UNZ18593.1 LPXTG cell wall anchor domain-containing protein [Streptomyces sp. 891-h]
MNRSRITSAAATAALLGGLGVAQLATAAGAFAYDSGADLHSGAATGFLYNRSTGEVKDGFSITVGNTGPEATRATLTVTGVKNVHFDTRKNGNKPSFKRDLEGGKAYNHNLTVKSLSDKQVVVSFDLKADNDEAEVVNIPGFISGEKQTLRTSIKGDKPDPDTSNNTKTMNYSVNAPDWNPDKPKPTEKPTQKPTEKPSDKPSKPSEPTQKPTSKPSKPSDDASDANTPAPAGGSDKGDSGKGGDLAETGSSSNTPLLVGGAGALVVIGGLAVFAAKRKKAGQN